MYAATNKCFLDIKLATGEPFIPVVREVPDEIDLESTAVLDVDIAE